MCKVFIYMALSTANVGMYVCLEIDSEVCITNALAGSLLVCDYIICGRFNIFI